MPESAPERGHSRDAFAHGRRAIRSSAEPTAVVATIVFAGISPGYARRAGAIVGRSPSPFTRRILTDITFMARRRGHAGAVYPVALLALLSIAPFYGFFSAPLFLGMSVNAMRPGRPIVTVVLATIGMRAGEQIGLATAGWLSGANAAGPGR